MGIMENGNYHSGFRGQGLGHMGMLENRWKLLFRVKGLGHMRILEMKWKLLFRV